MNNWNQDLSPWNAAAVFGKEEFGNGAKNTLKVVEKLCVGTNKYYCIGGYSMAGLFALWAASQTDRFAGIAAASPSIWFPGFLEYLKRCLIGIRSAMWQDVPERRNATMEIGKKLKAARMKSGIMEAWQCIKLY